MICASCEVVTSTISRRATGLLPEECLLTLPLALTEELLLREGAMHIAPAKLDGGRACPESDCDTLHAAGHALNLIAESNWDVWLQSFSLQAQEMRSSRQSDFSTAEELNAHMPFPCLNNKLMRQGS